MVGAVIDDTLQSLDLRHPVVGGKALAELKKVRRALSRDSDSRQACGRHAIEQGRNTMRAFAFATFTALALAGLLPAQIGPAAAQQRNLDIYWIDVEGGASTLIVSTGESLLSTPAMRMRTATPSASIRSPMRSA
jgi:hypothetical protein